MIRHPYRHNKQSRYMDFIFEPWHWFVMGILLILFELILPSFAALWFGVAAIVVSILHWLFPSMSFTVQIILWIILSISCTAAWFKFIKPLSVNKSMTTKQAREAVLGQTGMVIQTDMPNDLIRVRFTTPLLGVEEWSCRTVTPVQVGDRIQVIDFLGQELVVQPHSSFTQ